MKSLIQNFMPHIALNQQKSLSLKDTKSKMMLLLKTHLGYVHKIIPNEFLAENMPRIFSFFCFLVCMSYVSGVIVRYTHRYKSCAKSELEQGVDGGRYCENIVRRNEEIGSWLGLDSELATSTSKYQFSSGKNIIGFIERPENVCFSVQECCFVTSHDLSFCNSQLCDEGVIAERDHQEFVEKDEIIVQEEVDETSGNFSPRDDSGKELVVEDELSVVGEVLELKDSILGNRGCSDHYETDSVASSFEYLRSGMEANLIKYEFLPGKYFGKGLESESSGVANEMKVRDDGGLEMGEESCPHGRDVPEENDTLFREKYDNNDEELLKLDQYWQNPIGFDAEKLPDDDNCGVGVIHQDAAIIGTSDEANEPTSEGRVSVYDDHYGEHVGLGKILQKSIGSDAEKFRADGIFKVDSVHQEAEVTETLDEATEQKFREKNSVHVDYDEHLVTLDQHLQDYIEFDSEKLTRDYICQIDCAHQKAEELRNLDEAMEPILRRKISFCDDCDEELPRVDQHLENSIEVDAQKFSSASICEGELLHPEEEGIGTFDETMEPSLQGHTTVHDVDDSDDSDDSDQDHDDLVHQLKAELKRARTGGLPTILEESESPKVEADYLRPLKIDEKFQHKDRMEEIQKFYKSYADKMRKLDILNYQALNAISLHQKKDPNCLNSSQKSFNLALRSFVPRKLSLYKARRVAADPTLKCINLHKDLEMVYVGQVCLSWEILYWQYMKAKELQESDRQGFRQFNGVANDFQLFQVLIQRFLEDEPFEGPRVINYVNNRCNIRSILQIPALKDDSFKEQRFRKGMEPADAVSSRELIRIIEASMQTFWEFLCADKFACLNAKGSHDSLVELQDPADLELLHNIQFDLQKKEKKLREILRSGNCIIKRFQKRQGADQLHRALFFPQVELKIVSRVINMSKLTTNQLLWCREKLGRVDFTRNEIHVESMFLLFPC